MTSTTRSDVQLSVGGLNLAFNLRHYRQRTLRDAFVNFTRSPIEALLKPRESHHVLKNIEFTLNRGDRLALLGVNGCGKTSLCRTLAGLLHPNTGSIKRFGEVRAVFDTNVGIVPALTGRENARLLARLTYPRETGASLKSLVDEALEFSELGEFLDTPFETYSQGMKSRVFLSVTTALTADILILDEVYDNTDLFFQKKMTSRLLNFIHSSGAVIFVSHSPEHVRRICNRAIVLHEGKVACDGPVEDALAAYVALNEPAEKRK